MASETNPTKVSLLNMELMNLNGFFEMDRGAPSPIVMSNDNNLFIFFYNMEDEDKIDYENKNESHNQAVTILRFNRCLKYMFGIPGNETIQGHPYYELGMRSFQFYELRNSDVVEKLKNIERVHPYYDDKKWESYRHFILTFHDNMFECIARDFKIKQEHVSNYAIGNQLLNELIEKAF